MLTNAVVLWNTIYMQATLDHLRNEGEIINEEVFQLQEEGDD
ncbi:hypothetical protein EWN99_21740 [Salmonella enterica]|nr:hypothetical protein [Salmonella enterica]EBS3177243.1 hypothetical protein [Salmonella enterica subsp. enterica serovar Newport]EBS3869402.1 hypothetical protein [Salmonella enterica subsp. enterica serovar Kimberley]ECL1759215.1 Tn3 family transposase [Salmonella enterica]EEE9161460.1 Tn3 family transposase [Salmonella enterica subsp. enterica serovar Kimberley]